MVETQEIEKKPIYARFVRVFIVIAVAVMAAGYFSYKTYEKQSRIGIERELAAVADLKVVELTKWRSERLGDAEIIYKNAALSDLVARYFRNPQDKEAERKIQEWLGRYHRYADYDQARLLDPQGVTRMSFPPGIEPASEAVMEGLQEVVKSRRIKMIDFYRHDRDERIYISTLIPILDVSADNRPIGVISLRVDPVKYIYPFISRWLTSSWTAETLLVRREGNDVLFLNELKFREDSALSLRIPLERADVPAVKAILGQTGIVEGIDYRGVRVIADIRRVPGSPWFLVARIDKSEILAPVREHMWMLIGLVTALVFGVGAAMAFVWRQQSLVFYRERYKAAEELRRKQTMLARTEGIAHVGSWEWDVATDTMTWSDELFRIFQRDPAAGAPSFAEHSAIFQPDDMGKLKLAVEAALREGAPYELELRAIRTDGETRACLARGYAEMGRGKAKRLFGSVQDITERKRLEEAIVHLAHHDPLTGLPNRRLFMDIMNHELAEARRNGRNVALLFLDLDRFKEINDAFGHETGDELLKEVSKRLRASIRESDVAARIGGDEFNILLADIARTQDITLISKKIMRSFRSSFLVAEHEFRITASIGISIYPDDSDQIDTLYRYADIAMYHAKETGRNAVQFYNPDINTRSVERARMESMLRRSIDLGELVVYYQPLMNIRSGRIVCAEALVRWKHPEMGLLEPEQFISAAEDTGFIAVIDEYVLRTACAQVRSWMDAGLPAVCITVNLSARAFQNPELTGKISHIVRKSGISPECLNIEITESLAMHNIDRTIDRLRELAKMGVHAYIDDFGAGYSSLNHLKRLPIKKIKIDRSFIRDLAANQNDRAIINAITVMAHHMRMSVLAEGVETEEQLSYLRSTRCDEAQGYLFSKALPAEELGELLLTGNGQSGPRGK